MPFWLLGKHLCHKEKGVKTRTSKHTRFTHCLGGCTEAQAPALGSCLCDAVTVMCLALQHTSPHLALLTSQLDLRPVTSLQSVWWSLGYGWTCTFPQRFCCQPHLPLWTYPLLMLSEVKVLYHNPSTCRQGTRIMITALKKILTNQL